MTEKTVQIIEAAIRLFAEGGVAVPTAKIAKEAGISNGTLFNYFATKQDLIDDVYIAIKQNVAEHVLEEASADQAIEDFFHNVWRTYILWALDNPLKHQVGLLLKSSQRLGTRATEAADDIFHLLGTKVEQGITDKIIMDIPADYMCELAGAQKNAAISYIRNNALAGQTLQQHIETSFKIYWNGIKHA